jgi:hypothetical protein
MSGRSACMLCMWLALAVGCNHATSPSANSSAPTAQSLSVANASGLTMRVANEHGNPSLWLNVPDEAFGQDAVLVLLPEHVTVRRHGTNKAEHLYLWRSGQSGSRPNWMHVHNALQYEAEFALTCQHADPEIALPRRSKGIIEEKTLLFRGMLNDVANKVHQQRAALK